MNAKRLYYILLCSIFVLLIGLVFATVSVNRLLTTKADGLTQLKAKSAALDREQVTLKKTVRDLDTYTDLQKITQSIVPEDKSQAQAVREIVNIADQYGISLSAVTFPASTLGNSPNSAGGTRATAATSAPATPSNSKSGKLSQLTPVKNIPGVYQLPITVQSDPSNPVRYDKFVSFLNALERNRRTAQVSTITLDPSKDNRNYLSFTLTLNNYIRP